jgi:crotonobetainyl-CoA:carnitine CoA-transferase CaiB-like acyl-CoA transferase
VATDAHLTARDDIVMVDDTTVGRVRQQASFPRLLPVAPTITPAPTLGQHNVDVWCDELGLTPDEFDRHRSDGVI